MGALSVELEPGRRAYAGHCYLQPCGLTAPRIITLNIAPASAGGELPEKMA